MALPPLRVGYVPEHFSTPLYFAQKHFGLSATLIAFPSGTGHMVASLQSNEIDIGIGLTEGWITALGKQKEAAGFRLVGTYVETPLCWAISTGAERELQSVDQLNGKKIGFTSKRYYKNKSIKKIGEIYTPWSSWKIVARDDARDMRLEDLFKKLDQGIEYFEQHQEEAAQYISTELDYEEDDAREWLGTVKFAHGVQGVKMETVEKTVELLRKAGVLEGDVDLGLIVGRAQET